MPSNSAGKANILATRKASCNTGNRDTAAGPLTIIYPGGGIYHIESSNARHIRECITAMQAARAQAAAAVGTYDVVHALGTMTGSPH